MRLYQRLICITIAFLVVVFVSFPASADSSVSGDFTLTFNNDISSDNGVFITDLYSNGAQTDVAPGGVPLYTWHGVANWVFNPSLIFSFPSYSGRDQYLNGLLTFTYGSGVIEVDEPYFKIRSLLYQPHFLPSYDSTEYLSYSFYKIPSRDEIVVNLYFYNYPVSNDTIYIDLPSISCSQSFEMFGLSDGALGLNFNALSVSQGVDNFSSSVSVSAYPDTSKGLADIITQSIIVGLNMAGGIGGASTAQIEGLLTAILALDNAWLPSFGSSLSSLVSSNSEIQRVLGEILTQDYNLFLAISGQLNRIDTNLSSIYDLLLSYFNSTDLAVSESVINMSQSVGDIDSALALVPSADIVGALNVVDSAIPSGGFGSDFYFYLNFDRILVLVLLSVAFGILGYVLYGRGSG